MSDGIKEGSIFWNLQVKTDNAKKNVDKLSLSLNNLNKAFGLFKMTAFIKGLQQIGTTIANNLQKQAKYIQTQNTFTKALGESAKEAKEFRDALQGKLGIDAQESMTAMSTFQRLAENMGLTNKEAYLMSKNLTSLASDFTAYGYSFSEATTKLRSGLTGQIKGMKALGVSLDEATLQQTLYSLGIERTVSSLTKAQKTELLYYQIMTQTSKMQNTLAETMNSPANMLRILQQEFTQLGRAIGTVFIPIAMKIIPVVRAIVQELKKLAEWLGVKAGYNESDYTGYYDSLLDISDGFDDIEDSATGAGKAINKMLMPFDELNNINFSKATGIGAGVGTGGSLFDSLEELPNYDVFKGLDENIGKKVDEYKEKIEKLIPLFETLGTVAAAAFGIGKLAEFITWTDKVHTALSNLGALGGLIEIGFGALLSIGGIWAMWKGTKKLLNGDYSIWAVLETIGGTAIGTFGIATALRGLATMTGYELPLHKALGIGLSIMMIIQGFEVIDDAIKNQDIGKFILGTFENILGFGTLANQLLPKGKHSSNFSDLKWAIGIGIAITFAEVTYEYSKKAYEDMKKINTEEFDRQGIFKDIGTATATGAIAGSMFGPIGAGIGATAGLLISSFSAINAGVTELKNLKNDTTEVNKLFVSVLESESEEYLTQKANIDELIKAYDARIESINKTKEADLLNLKVTENYIEDLDKLVDSNGQVIAGNEKRVDFILGELNNALGTEYSLNEGLITSNGKAIDSYDSMKQNLQELMEKKRQEAEQTANIELYKEAYTQRQRMLENFNTKYAEVQRLRAELQEKEKNGLQKGSDEWKSYQGKINEALLLSNEAYEGWIEANELATQRGVAAFGEMEQTVSDTMSNISSNMYQQSFWIPEAIHNALTSSKAAQLVVGAVEKIASKIPSKFLKVLDIKSPSKVMYEAAQWVPAGVAEGIDSKASLVEDSMENLTDKMRIDQQDFDFYSSADLASSINGKIQTQTSAALNENTLQNMANATYEAMSRALIDNNDDYNPQFNVYVGNDKVYSGYANYQNNESNKYGVKV